MHKWSIDMTNLISNAIARLTSLIKGFQVKQFLAVALVGFLLLTTNAQPGSENKALTKQVRERVHQGDSQRPKTTGEWLKEARQDAPLDKRIEQIGGESAAAVKDFGKLYPDTAKRSSDTVRNNG
jgi:hypothetical protein